MEQAASVSRKQALWRRLGRRRIESGIAGALGHCLGRAESAVESGAPEIPRSAVAPKESSAAGHAPLREGALMTGCCSRSHKKFAASFFGRGKLRLVHLGRRFASFIFPTSKARLID